MGLFCLNIALHYINIICAIVHYNYVYINVLCAKHPPQLRLESEYCDAENAYSPEAFNVLVIFIEPVLMTALPTVVPTESKDAL